MATVDITEANFQETVEKNDIVIIDFWAEWCGPCKSFAPIYEEVSEDHEDVVFGKVNTEEQQQLGAHFQIRSIPTLMVFREGIILYQEAGMMNPQQLEGLIGKVKELDMEQVRSEVEAQANK